MHKSLGYKIKKEKIIDSLKKFDMLFIEFNNYESLLEILKELESIDYISEWKEDNDLDDFRDLNLVKNDLKKKYKSLWLNISTTNKNIDITTFNSVFKYIHIHNSHEMIGYGSMLEKSDNFDDEGVYL